MSNPQTLSPGAPICGLIRCVRRRVDREATPQGAPLLEKGTYPRESPGVERTHLLRSRLALQRSHASPGVSI
jgi:hypothetical protein